MTDDGMTLIALAAKSADIDLAREMLLEPVAQGSCDPVDRMKAEEGRRRRRSLRTG